MAALTDVKLLFVLYLCLFVCPSEFPTQSPTPPLLRSEPIVVSIDVVKVLPIALVIAIITAMILVHLIIVVNVRFVRFNTCINILSKKTDYSACSVSLFLAATAAL